MFASFFLFAFDILGLGFGITNSPVGLNCCQFSGSSKIGLVCLQFPGASHIGLILSFNRAQNLNITMSQRSRAGNPSMRSPASGEIISDSVELCETDGLFLAHPTDGGKMFSFYRYTGHLLRLTLSPQDLQQCLGLGRNPIDNAEPCCRHDNIVGGHLCDECVKSILPVVCHMPESIL